MILHSGTGVVFRGCDRPPIQHGAVRVPSCRWVWIAVGWLVFQFEKGLDVGATEGVGLLLAVVGCKVVVGLIQAHGSGMGAMGI